MRVHSVWWAEITSQTEIAQFDNAGNIDEQIVRFQILQVSEGFGIVNNVLIQNSIVWKNVFYIDLLTRRGGAIDT